MDEWRPKSYTMSVASAKMVIQSLGLDLSQLKGRGIAYSNLRAAIIRREKLRKHDAARLFKLRPYDVGNLLRRDDNDKTYEWLRDNNTVHPMNLTRRDNAGAKAKRSIKGKSGEDRFLVVNGIEMY